MVNFSKNVEVEMEGGYWSQMVVEAAWSYSNFEKWSKS